MKNILFIIDELEFKYFELNKLVTNFWFIWEFLRRGYNVSIATKGKLFIEDCCTKVLCFNSSIKGEEIIYDKQELKKSVNDFDTVIFRPDPPVDIEYITACYVFEFVDKKKTCVINDPLAVKDFNEKFHINYFPNYIPKNIVTSSKQLIKRFVFEENEAILKPLNRCFGSGVYYLKNGDKNINTIIDNATNAEKTPVMVQKYINSSIKGDKRVLIAGETVFEECVYKLAGVDDFKFNTHSDTFFERAMLTQNERKMAQDIANKLSSKGLYLVGLDVMDDKVIEINITSPCYFIKEINNFYNIQFERKIVDVIEKIVDNYFSNVNKEIQRERVCAL